MILFHIDYLVLQDVPPYLIPQIKILPHTIHIDSGRPWQNKQRICWKIK
jgi:hypothetical protein